MKIDVDKLAKKRTRRNPALDGVPGLARGLEVLEYLARYPQGKTQKEIAEAVGLPAASASRITLLLEAAGYLWRDPDTKAFRHSMKMLMVGQRALFDADVIGLALPYMRAIRDRNGYPVASIWITGPAQNCPPKNIPAVGAKVVAAAQAVSHRLGFG